MYDDLGLLPGEPDGPDGPAGPAGPPPSRRPLGLLLAGLVVVALLAVAGVLWVATTLADRGSTVTAASPAATATAAPATTTAAATVPPEPTATSASPTPLQSAATVIASATPSPTPKPTPKPTPRPAPKPTPSTPAGKVVAVPDVIGLRVQQAGTVLRKAGLKVQVLGGVLDPDRDDRRVVAQRPTPGSVVRAGSTVILVTNGT